MERVAVKYYANHNTAQQVWCKWSYTNAPADAKPEDQCPDGCETSRVITGSDKIKVVIVVAEEPGA